MNPDIEIAVLGGGIAGLSAALQAASLGAAVTLVEQSELFGGQIANLGVIDDYCAPGPISGQALATDLVSRSRDLGCQFRVGTVNSIEYSEQGCRILLADGQTLRAANAIVASGSRLRQLGVPGETELAGRGVSQCDWCDGGLYRQKDVVIVGSGDAALQATLHLAPICRSVAIVSRGGISRARPSYLNRALDIDSVTFHWETRVERINGTQFVESVSVCTEDASEPVTLHCDGVFIFAGTEPNTSFLPLSLAREAHGLVLTSATFETSLKGIYAAGSARFGYCGQLTSAAGEGAGAATQAVARLRQSS